MTQIIALDLSEKFFFTVAADLKRIVPDLPAGFSLADHFHGKQKQQIIAALAVSLFHEVVALQNSEPHRSLIARLEGDRAGWLAMGREDQATIVQKQKEMYPPLKEYRVAFREIETLAQTLCTKGFKIRLPFIHVQSDKTQDTRDNDLLAKGPHLVHGGAASLVHPRMKGNGYTYFAYNWFKPDGERKPLEGKAGIMDEVMRDQAFRLRP